uniref:glutathione transferase n=1 Tax=Chironomus riparius TaxID=315576 RepID=F4MI60_9DIPT
MSYKINYFTFKGLGEPVRFMLAYGNVEFVDNRIEWEDWHNLKLTMPLGQMPVLEADGEVFHHCIPICRYLGNKFNLAGQNALENYKIDCAAETVNEFRGKIAMWYYFDKQVKDEKYEKLANEVIPFYLEKLEQKAKENDGHLALRNITWADVYAIAVMEYCNVLMGSDLIANYPSLKKVYEKVMASGGVKKYLATRPEDRIPNF